MITASKQLWLWLTAHGGLGRCRYLTSSSYCHKCFLFLCRSVRVQTLLKLTVVSFLSFPRLFTAVLPETQGGDVRREGVEAFNAMRQMTLDPVKCAAVSVHCWRITDVERTAAYEELRKQWRAESLIAHLTVFKDKHGLWTQRKHVQSCSCQGLNISSECRACFTQRMHHRSQLLLLHLSPHAYKVNTTFTKCFCVILPALLIRLKHNI